VFRLGSLKTPGAHGLLVSKLLGYNRSKGDKGYSEFVFKKRRVLLKELNHAFIT
jgi:hypothetical protein